MRALAVRFVVAIVCCGGVDAAAQTQPPPPSPDSAWQLAIVHRPHPGELVDPVRALTIGAVRDLVDVRGFKLGLGGDVVFHRVPELLEFTHGANVRSAHLFLRLRPPARGGRMWNTTMGRPMGEMSDAMHQHR